MQTVKYNISINHGDNNTTTRFYFVHKDYQTLSKEEQDKAFDAAVKELNHIYKDYGRFATTVGVCKLFEKFGFERTIEH